MADATRRARLIIEAKDAVTGETDKAARSLGGLKSSLSSLNQEAGSLVKSFIGPAALIGALKGSIDAAMEAQRVMTQTETVIKSTGGAAGMTAEEIEKLAGAESRLTSIDDEVIQSGQNMLLTFTNIGGEVFPRATRAMQDMAVAFAQGDTSAIDLQGTAIQLGKALNDPERGLLALRRVGVAFTESQKAAIKEMMAMNDVAGAQALILAELEKEFGGSAEAAGTNLAGKLQKAQNAIENLGEAIGNELIPFLGQAADAATTLMTSGEQLAEVFVKHQKDISIELKSGTRTLESYNQEIIRSGQLTGDVSSAFQGLEKNQAQNMSTTQRLSQRIVEINGEFYRLSENVQLVSREMFDGWTASQNYAHGMTEADFAAQRMASTLTDELPDALEETKEALDANADSLNYLKGLMAGAVGDEMTKFSDKQEELRAKAIELQGTISTSYGKARDDARASLADVNQSLADNAAAHEEATKRILFDIAAQQLSVDGLTSVELQSLNMIAKQWGLVDQATATATEAILVATGQLAADQNPEAFVEKLDNINKILLDGSIPTLRTMTDAALVLSGDIYTATINTADLGGAVEDTTPKVGNLTPQLSGAAGAAGALAGQASAARDAINSIQDKTVTITTIYREQHITDLEGRTGRQFGGPVSGGRPYLVGEGGPEMFVPGAGGFVMDNADTQKMLSLLKAIASGVGNTRNVTVNAGAGVDTDAIIQAIDVGLGRRARLMRSSGATVMGT